MGKPTKGWDEVAVTGPISGGSVRFYAGGRAIIGVQRGIIRARRQPRGCCRGTSVGQLTGPARTK
jgi:hypothetical protein